ncbi:hypothetical protein [Xylella fastidiosa]|uniref:hypothetical protein n=1 Tax=Xylella fastidiosa TaxID=2371 RepID=UPI001F22E9D4|nr:hypothetical protein [Xylella fastidiosa]
MILARQPLPRLGPASPEVTPIPSILLQLRHCRSLHRRLYNQRADMQHFPNVPEEMPLAATSTCWH